MQQEIPNPLDSYTQRGRELDSAAEEINRRCTLYLAASLVLVLLACVFVYGSFIAKRLPIWTTIFPIAAAAFATKQIFKDRRKILKLYSVREYYDKGIARLKRDWDLLDDGKDFIEFDHIYATDLDLFGRGSLFQLLCSARTHVGRETLATWMKNITCQEEVLARREAISELRERRDLFESVAAVGTTTVSDCRPGTFRNWVAEILSQSQFPLWAQFASFLLVFVLLGLPVFYWTGHLDLRNLSVIIGAVLAIELAFATLFSRQVRFILESAHLPSVELPIIAELLRIIELERFSSPKLAALATRVKRDGIAASSCVYRLSRLVRLLEEHNGMAPLSWCLLWCTQFSMSIDRWHRRHGLDLLQWLGALGEFEALLSLSVYASEHPLDTFPEIVQHGPSFDAEKLGHPILDEKICVPNDVKLGEDVRFLIISGSNMSGKSTFLRAIGVNTVLAWMGAPVRCAKLRISRVEIAAAIRIQDSLTDGRSHFYAEMQRLRRIIDRACEGPLLFLTDEIMSGTNSHDRRIATEWVIRALILRNAIGLITTHDLTLTEIAGNGLPGRNVYFEDTGESGNLKFDYKLHSGLLTRSNALNIAHLLGIDVHT